ncbi:MAG: pyruvate ferredoxin oxidoreductase [Candidatus Ranarchaeia archaeon]
MKEMMMTGNYAAAEAVIDSKVQVVPAYPITPQTSIIERIASLIEERKLKTKFLMVESEHSAMAACIGASSTGVRTYTATASQGLALMCEGLHWAARGRLPIVLTNVNRALAPPWSIWVDHHDSMSQRDTGWIQFYVGNNQEVYDTTVMAFRLSEDDNILLPSMVCLDGFILSHTYAPVKVFEGDEIDNFLKPYNPSHLNLDPDNPFTMGNMMEPDYYFEHVKKIHEDQNQVLNIFPKIQKEFKKLTGRTVDIIDEYKMEDAEIGLLVIGTLGEEAKLTIDKLRTLGHKIGLIRLILFRPFPIKKINEISEKLEGLIIVERSISFGEQGQITSEVKAALFDKNKRPKIQSLIMGLGGQDVNYQDLEEVIIDILKKWERKEYSSESVFRSTASRRKI